MTARIAGSSASKLFWHPLSCSTRHHHLVWMMQVSGITYCLIWGSNPAAFDELSPCLQFPVLPRCQGIDQRQAEQTPALGCGGIGHPGTSWRLNTCASSWQSRYESALWPKKCPTVNSPGNIQAPRICTKRFHDTVNMFTLFLDPVKRHSWHTLLSAGIFLPALARMCTTVTLSRRTVLQCLDWCHHFLQL